MHSRSNLALQDNRRRDQGDQIGNQRRAIADNPAIQRPQGHPSREHEQGVHSELN